MTDLAAVSQASSVLPVFAHAAIQAAIDTTLEQRETSWRASQNELYIEADEQIADVVVLGLWAEDVGALARTHSCRGR
jgi:hypothetical protein